MAARDIERYNLDYSIEENLYRWVKRGCVGFAGMAMTLGVLDIAGIHSISTAGNFWRSANANLISLSGQLRTGISSIALLPDRNDGSVTVRIVPPRKIEGVSPVDRLAALRNSDAIEIAMAPPVQKLKPQQVALTVPQPPAPPAAAPVRTEPKPELKPAPAKIESAAASLPAVTPAAAPAASSALPATPLPAAALPATQPEPPAVAPAATMRLASIDPSATAPQATTPAVTPVSIPLIQLGQVPLPTAAPGVPPPSPAERLRLDDKQYAKAQRCLANAIYFESRSEPVRGQMAVAQVVVNRTFSGFYPDNICDVVYQNAHRRLACQFTFACDGKSKAIHDRGSWSRANRIAKQTLDGQIYLPEVGKSTHYHAAYVRPIWAREMRKLARYGLHSFYRPFAWGNGAEMPAWGRAMAQAKKPGAH